MKKAKIVFWITTTIIFLMEGVMTALTFNTPMAKESFIHLGYPAYFGVMLSVFKVLGALALIIPKVPGRIKEWAYVGFAIDFISAFVSMWVIDGIGAPLILPVIFSGILVASYLSYHKLHSQIKLN